MSEASGKTKPVLIAGGGIGGLAAALTLAAKGRRSHVLEQSAKFGEIGAGIQLGPNVFFRDSHPQVLGLLAKINAWKMWVLCDCEPMKTWSAGRVTLLGDAAHPMLQYLAQGACMAVEDAVVLADKVEAAGDDHRSAFAAYQDARYLRTARVQLTARFYGEFYHAGGVTAEVRNAVFGKRTPQQALEGMAWLYDGI